MDRLLAGRPQRTDGRLIKDNLWKEADVSRATMNRATRILAEWDTRVADCGRIHAGRGPQERRTHHPANKTRGQDPRVHGKLHHQLDAAATAIAALHHDNILLRQELGQHGDIIALQHAPPPADAHPGDNAPIHAQM